MKIEEIPKNILDLLSGKYIAKGYVKENPILEPTANGVACRFHIVVMRENGKDKDFIPGVCWNEVARHFVSKCKAGTEIYFLGVLHNNKSKDGKYYLIVECEDFKTILPLNTGGEQKFCPRQAATT